MPGDNGDTLDARIDAGLRSYAEPPASISDSRIAAATILGRARRPRSRSWLWIWAIPAAACLALAVGLLWWFHAPSAPNVARAVPTAPALAVPSPPAPAVRRAHLRVVRRSHAAATSLPKLEVFPTPAPLSAQELELVTFVRHAPPAVREAVMEEQSQSDQAPTAGTPKTEMEAPEKENR